MFTCTCASRHSGVQFFDIVTSKSGPNMVCFVHVNFKSGPKVLCFVHFDLAMCFAPQGRAIVHFSFDHMAPHPPLWRACLSTLLSYESLEKTHFATFLAFFSLVPCFFWLSRAPDSTFFYLYFSALLFIWLYFSALPFRLYILSEVWLLNFPRILVLVLLRFYMLDVDLNALQICGCNRILSGPQHLRSKSRKCLKCFNFTSVLFCMWNGQRLHLQLFAVSFRRFLQCLRRHLDFLQVCIVTFRSPSILSFYQGSRHESSMTVNNRS